MRIDIAPCDAAKVRHILAAALTEKTGAAGRFDLDKLIDGAVCFGVWEEGRLAGAYLLAEEGSTVWIRAAIGSARADLTRSILAAVEYQCRQFDRIGFQTIRAGLVRKAQQLGYTVKGMRDGFTVMEKKLT
jgi:hypothetical protein